MSEFELFRKVEQWASLLRAVVYIAAAVGLVVALWR